MTLHQIFAAPAASDDTGFDFEIGAFVQHASTGGQGVVRDRMRTISGDELYVTAGDLAGHERVMRGANLLPAPPQARRVVRLEIVDSEVIGGAVLSLAARAINGPEQRFVVEMALDHINPAVAEFGRMAFVNLCAAVGAEDVHDSADLHFLEFDALVAGDRILTFCDHETPTARAA